MPYDGPEPPVWTPDNPALTEHDHDEREREPERDRALDDIGNAARYADQHANAVRFVPAFRQWLHWDGARFAKDDRLEHLRRAKSTARRLAEEAAGEESDQRRKDLLAHARRSAAEPRLRAMLTIAASDRRIVASPRDLDRDPWILNTPSGVVDLRTGELRARRREDHLTLLTGASYDPWAEATRWHSFLERVLPDEAVRRYLQRLVGLSAIGTTLEHMLVLMFGPGANGKSVTLNVIAHVLGDYAHQSTIDLLLQGGRGGGRATPELADLRGRRFVTVSETPEDGRLASERVKSITGGDPITARYLQGNPFTFEPSHTVWLGTNHKPRVPDDSEGIWRRITLIDFAVTIPEAEQDRQLGDKLAREGAGILRWIVDGARLYLEHGLDRPDVVKDATADYRAEEDVFGAFLSERAIVEKGASAQAAEIGKAFNKWAERNGHANLTTNAVAEKLKARGFERSKSKKGARWHGLRLRDEGQTLDV